MAQQQTMQNVNGIDVAALAQTVDAVRQNPSLGAFDFRAANRWLGGAHNRSTVGAFRGADAEVQRAQPFVLDCDEPPVLLGEDRAANPVEHVLHALAGCLTTSMVYHAASRGIVVESVRSGLQGDLDIRGFLGLSTDVAKGYRDIRVTLRVKSDAPAEQLAALAKFSPVWDTLARPVRVTVDVVKES